MPQYKLVEITSLSGTTHNTNKYNLLFGDGWDEWRGIEDGEYKKISDSGLSLSDFFEENKDYYLSPVDGPSGNTAHTYNYFDKKDIQNDIPGDFGPQTLSTPNNIGAFKLGGGAAPWTVTVTPSGEGEIKGPSGDVWRNWNNNNNTFTGNQPTVNAFYLIRGFTDANMSDPSPEGTEDRNEADTIRENRNHVTIRIKITKVEEYDTEDGTEFTAFFKLNSIYFDCTAFFNWQAVAGMGVRAIDVLAAWLEMHCGCPPETFGDPYVTTLSGITYKMADFTGFSRMLQGTLENKPFTLNTETTLLTKEELTDLAIQRNKLFSEEIIEGYKVDEFPAYFSKLHASWAEDSVTIDLKTFEVIHSTTNEEYETKSSMGKQYNWSTKETKEEKMFIPFGPVTLVVKNIPNVDVRNGFTVLGNKHITDKVGALVKPMYVKDIKLKSLTSTKFIKDVKDRTPKKTIKQVFRTKAGEIIEKDMPIY